MTRFQKYRLYEIEKHGPKFICNALCTIVISIILSIVFQSLYVLILLLLASIYNGYQLQNQARLFCLPDDHVKVEKITIPDQRGEYDFGSYDETTTRHFYPIYFGRNDPRCCLINVGYPLISVFQHSHPITSLWMHCLGSRTTTRDGRVYQT